MKIEETPRSAPSSFETLGQYILWHRLRLGLSQEALAEAIGASARSLRRWEHDLVFPQKMWRERLAQQFGLAFLDLLGAFSSEAELSFSTLPSLWTVPYQRNSYFTGRESILQQIHEHLSPSQATDHPRSLALSGLGGMGKTHTALEYAYRHAQDYTATFWLQAENAHTLHADLVALAEVLNLPQVQEQSRVLKAVQRWLSTHRDWLLILDNVQEIAVVHKLLPGMRQGSLLFTTRLPTLGTLAHLLPLEPLTNDEGMRFLWQRIRNRSIHSQSQVLTEQERLATEALCMAMDGLPLALDQAGAYLLESGCQIADYLRRYQKQRKQVLARRGLHEGSHPDSVAVTVKLSLEQAARQHPAAPDLLRLCSFLHPAGIPEELLVAGAPYLGRVLEPYVADSYQFDQVMAALRGTALIQRQRETKTLTIHRLVQSVCQDLLEPAEGDLWRERILLALNAAFPDVAYETWGACQRLSAHASLCLQTLSETVLPREQVTLSRKMAEYLRQQGHYQEAELLLQRARAIQEHILGVEHPESADLLCQLANLLYTQSRYAEAELLYQRALALQEQELGPEHLGIARVLNGLADICFNRGHYQEAEALYRRAFSMQEHTLGPEHPEMALFCYNVAEIALQQGHYTEAQALYQRALHIQERTLGLEHPEVANILNGLAMLSFQQDQYAEAETYFQRALHIREHTLGPEHPHVATILNNVAGLYHAQGREAEIELPLLRALRIWEQELGPDHPNIAYPLNNLADLYASQKRYLEAEAFYQRACSLWEQAVGADYHMLSHPLGGLATMYMQQGRYQEAEPLYQRALALCETQLGVSHPQTAQVLSALAVLSQQQGSTIKKVQQGCCPQKGFSCKSERE